MSQKELSIKSASFKKFNENEGLVKHRDAALNAYLSLSRVLTLSFDGFLVLSSMSILCLCLSTIFPVVQPKYFNFHSVRSLSGGLSTLALLSTSSSVYRHTFLIVISATILNIYGDKMHASL